MRIYIDARCLQEAKYSQRGIGHHSISLLRHARTLAPNAHRIALIDPAFPTLDEHYRELFDEVVTSRTPRPSLKERTIFCQLSPMTHDPMWVAPFLQRSGIISIAIFYDFIPLDDPNRYLTEVGDRRSYFTRCFWLKQYDLFGSISKYVTRRLQEVLGISVQRVAVTGAALRSAFICKSDREVCPTRQDYFFMVGGADSRKNVETALAAHAQLLRKNPHAPALIVVGDYPDWHIEQLTNTYQEQGGSRDRLEFLRGRTDEELVHLYHHALASICPSRDEGFSLPVAESHACRCPILASDIEAHRELIANAEARFHPDDVDSLAKKMERVWKDPGYRNDLLKQQPSENRFSERQVASRFWSHALSQTPVVMGRIRSRKPRLAVIANYPQDGSAINEHTAKVLRSLAKVAEIDLFSEMPESSREPWIRRLLPPTNAPYLGDDYDRVIPIIGNGGVHSRALELQKRFGGACLLQDHQLADLYLQRHGLEGFTALGSRLLGRAVPTSEAKNWFDRPWLLPIPFLEELLPSVDPLIVHSRRLQKNLKENFAVEAEYLPYCLQSRFTAEDLGFDSRRVARHRLGIPEDQRVIVSMGQMRLSKAPLELIWALEYVHFWGLPAHLYFVGESEVTQRVADLAHALGLKDFVHILDRWLPEAEYRDHLLSADAAIQLHTPGYGSLSRVLLDCIDAGLPTVTTHELGEAIKAPDYVKSIPDHLSPLLMAEGLREILGTREDRSRIEPERGRFLREHDFDGYASRLLEILEVK